jgi:hypothetical protein
VQFKVGISRASVPNDIWSDDPEDVKEILEDIKRNIDLPDIGVTYLEHLITQDGVGFSLYFVTTFFSFAELQKFIAQVGHRVIIGESGQELSDYFDYELVIYDSWVE